MAEITMAYQRLEKVVLAHLNEMQKALETMPAPSNEACGVSLDRSAADLSVLSGGYNDENVLNVMQGSD